MQILKSGLWAPNSFRFRLFATFSVLTLIISIFLIAFHSYREIRSFNRNTEEKAKILSNQLATAIRLPLFADNTKLLTHHAAATARNPGVNRVAILANDGKVLVESGTRNTQNPAETIAHEIEVQPDPLDYIESEFIGAYGNPGKVLGKVRVEMDSTELQHFLQTTLFTSTVTLIGIWLVATWISAILVSRITKSLTPLTNGLKVMQSGDYSIRIPSATYDELADASCAANNLAEELQKREDENSRLQKALIDAMQSEVREERRQMMAKLIQTNRMTSLGLLVSSMAHEINTPNGAIKLASHRLGNTWKDAIPILDRVANEEGSFFIGGLNYSQARYEVINSLETILRSSERIERVIMDLRDYSTGGKHNPGESASIKQVVEDALSIVRSHGKLGNIRIEPLYGTDVPSVAGDRYQLGQVVTNLLLNAIQSFPDGEKGLITIALSSDKSKGEVSLSIGDNGEGIPFDIRDRLKEPFFSTRLEKGGSGLGLYISNYIVSEHKGRLEIASNPGEGTVVTVIIPAVASTDEIKSC